MPAWLSSRRILANASSRNKLYASGWPSSKPFTKAACQSASYWNHRRIRLYHPESDSLELLAYNLAGKNKKKEWQRMGERFRTLIARPGDGLSGWATRHGETVRCGELRDDPRYIEIVPGLLSGLYV